MINPNKLAQLEKGQRRRKLALCFGALERDILGIAEKGSEYNFKNIPRADYTKQLIKIVLTDPALPSGARDEITALLEAVPFDEYRACNITRNHLLAVIGTFPAEWDLIIAPHKRSATSEVATDTTTVVVRRDYFQGIYVYAEDIRSPFNLGSIFRTAEALGAEKVFISPGCVPPDHPRAIRSGMGCIENIPWERKSLDELPKDLPVFLLETGGTPINEFDFPQKGIVIIGSEELGVSPAAIARATHGCVSIPMKGIKASLNVGVAFGILLQEWTKKITRD